MKVSKVRRTDYRPTAGKVPALERKEARPGAALVRVCKYCGSEFARIGYSENITCTRECANRQRVKNSIKAEYWWVNDKGYYEGRVWINGKRSRVRQHRWIMEKHLGRRLSPWEHVHHKDGNRQNNEITNLEVIDHVQHALLHNAERRKACGWNPPEYQVRCVRRRSEERRARRENQVI